MPFNSFVTAAASMVSLASLASAHMIMLTPTPFNNASIDNSPLSSSGANFPCKSTGGADFYNRQGIDNTMAVGQPQTLSFRGSAVHGGGSCQVAITDDKAPTASTTWQVILSIEGGCPSKDGSGPSTYDYTIPDSVKAGDYILAWTWISKLAGQPEYYMNCAPITVTGGGGKKRKRSSSSSGGSSGSRDLVQRDGGSLPNLFVANLQSVNSCKTTPGTDPQFPDPGPTVQKPGTSPKYATPAGTDCFPAGGKSSGGSSGGSDAGSTGGSSTGGDAGSAGGSSSGSDYGSSGSPSSAAAPAPAPTSASAPAADPSAAAAPTPATTSAAVPAAASSPTASVIATPVPDSTGGSSTAGGGGGSTAGSTSGGTGGSTSGSTGGSTGGTTSTAGALSGPCTSEGMWNCLGGSSFQRCASGAWSPAQPLAGGTSCSPGQAMNMAITKRFVS